MLNITTHIVMNGYPINSKQVMFPLQVGFIDLSGHTPFWNIQQVNTGMGMKPEMMTPEMMKPQLIKLSVTIHQ